MGLEIKQHRSNRLLTLRGRLAKLLERTLIEILLGGTTTLALFLVPAIVM